MRFDKDRSQTSFAHFNSLFNLAQLLLDCFESWKGFERALLVIIELFGIEGSVA